MGVGRRLAENTGERTRTIQRLATGERIVRSGDDAAGLSISEKLKSRIRSIQMASRNTQDGISIVQTAEGGVTEAQNILIRLRELSVQAASDTVGGEERSYINAEFQHLKSEISRIAKTTRFNGAALLDGSGTPMEFQVGIDNGGADRLTYQAGDANLTTLAIGLGTTGVESKEGALKNLPKIDGAIHTLNNFRSYLGSLQSSLMENAQNIDTHRTNLSAANSRVRDADIAEWTSKDARDKILQETNVAMLAQANTVPQTAVKLLENA